MVCQRLCTVQCIPLHCGLLYVSIVRDAGQLCTVVCTVQCSVLCTVDGGGDLDGFDRDINNGGLVQVARFFILREISRVDSVTFGEGCIAALRRFMCVIRLPVDVFPW